MPETETPTSNPPAVSSEGASTPPVDTTSTPATPQTPSPAAQPTDREKALMADLIRENNRRIQQQQNEIEQLKKRTSEAPKPPASPDDTRTRFYNDPVASTREIIRNELNETVAPLLDFVKSFRGEGTPYDKAKRKFASDPRFATLLSDPKINAALDLAMQNQEPREDLMQAAIIQIAGLQMTGQLDLILAQNGIMIDTPTYTPPQPQTPPPTPPVSQTPAYIPPSAPRTPADAPSGRSSQRRELNEHERRLARERNMTDDQFLDWLEVPAADVVKSKIGRA